MAYRRAKNKHRGFIVDYIGLANNLSEALSIYSEEDRQDLENGLKDALSELPILEERYHRLLQHFQSCGIAEIEGFVNGRLSSPEAEVEVLNRAVGALQKIQPRADFDDVDCESL